MSSEKEHKASGKKGKRREESLRSLWTCESRYNRRIEDKLYTVETHSLAIPPHTLQLKSSEHLVCLLCCKTLELPTTEDGLEQHFTEHLPQELAMKAYHKTFFRGTIMKQFNQIYFLPYNNDSVHCIVCDTIVLITNVPKHLNSTNHSSSNKLDLYWTLDDLTAISPYNTEEFVIHKCNQLKTCHCCHTPVKNVEAHLNSDNHKQCMIRNNAVDRLKIYYALWDMEFKDYKEYQKYFMVQTYKSFTCLICKDRVGHSHLKKHLSKMPCNFIQTNSPFYDAKWANFRDEFTSRNAPSFDKCDKDVIMKFYSPKEVFDMFKEIDGIKVYTIQKRIDNDGKMSHFCLLCERTVCTFTDDDQGKLQTIMHLKFEAHVNATYNIALVKKLYHYHQEIMNASLAVQMYQDTLRARRKKLKCMKCLLQFEAKTALAHITKLCPYALEAVNNSTTGNGTVLVTQHKEKDNNPNEGEILSYCDDVLLTIYEICNTPKGYRRPPILTVQCRNGHEKYCLACKMQLVSAFSHINSSKHTIAVDQTFSILTAYHKYWMAQSPEVQSNQIYFNPSSETHVSCAICPKTVPISEIHLHSNCIDKIRKKDSECDFPEEFRKFDLTYDSLVMRKLFYGIHYDISRSIFKTEIPVSFTHKAHIYCLLCDTPKERKLYREAGLLKRHLYRLHAKHSNKRSNDINKLVAYHKFWSQQKPEHQHNLIYYVIKTSDTVQCPFGHLIPLANAVEHFETKGECGLFELVQTESKVRSKERAVIEDMEKLKIGDNKKSKDAKGEGGVVQEHEVMAAFPDINTAGTSEDGSDQMARLPIYLQPHLSFFQFNQAQNTVYCTVCTSSVLNDSATLRNHVCHNNHIRHLDKKTFDLKIKYVCEICPVELLKEKPWLDHLGSKTHITKINNLGFPRKGNVKEYACCTCKTVIFGDTISVIRHQDVGVVKQPRPGTLTIGIKELLNSRRKIEDAAKNLIRDSDKFEAESTPGVMACIADVKAILINDYPSLAIHEFGSRVVGFTNKESDLDLYIETGAVSENVRDHQKIVSNVTKILKSDPRTFKDLLPILSARVPIIKVLHAPTQIDCDLSFTNALSVQNTRLIKFYVDYEPIFREAVLVLKDWGQKMNPKLKNDLTSYALCMMLIFKMQLDGFLPSVHKMREASTFTVLNIAGWDTVDYSKVNVDELRQNTHRPDSIVNVLSSFFKFYGKQFLYASDVACPLLGKTFQVKQFNNKGATLPVEMYTYQRKVEKDPDAQFRCMCGMFVQDPFDLGHNLTKNINKQFVNNFKRTCNMSYEHMVRK